MPMHPATEPTPIPWIAHHNCGINLESYSQSSAVSGTGEHADQIICGCFFDIGGKEVASANAQLIVRAVNSHAALVAALEGLLEFSEKHECYHETTHRGGVFWTICDDCGKMWADDKGGFQPYVEPGEIATAKAALAATRQ